MTARTRISSATLVVAILSAALSACGSDAGPEAAGRLVVDPAVDRERIAVVDLPSDTKVAVEVTDKHTIALQRQVGGGRWSDLQVIRTVDDTCGRVEAIASGRAVAAVARCDLDYSEDEATTRDVAVVTPDATGDLDRWESRGLRGYSDLPGISPDGRHAVWTDRSGHRALLWSATDGFDHRPLAGGDRASGSPAVAIDDRGRVSLIALSDSADLDGPCVVHVSGTTRQRFAVEALKDGCGEGSPHLSAPGRIEIGQDPSGVTLGLVDGEWKVTGVGPIHAPGLLEIEDGPLPNELYPLTDGSWVSVSSSDRRRVTAQRLAADGRRWSTPMVIYDRGFPGCSGGYETGPLTGGPSDVIVTMVSCYPAARADGRYPPRDADGDVLPTDGNVALVTTDGRSWTRRMLGAAFPAEAPDGSWVALPGTSPLVVTEGGTTTLPGRSARCDLLVSWTRGTLLRFTGGDASSQFWPTRLESLDVADAAAGKVDWQTVGTFDPGRHKGTCATASSGSDPGRFVTGQFFSAGEKEVESLDTEQSRNGSWAPVTRE